LILLAAAVTLLNAFKPILPDDAVYFLFAEHITLHPLDPYGFDLWDLQSANATLAPPVFLYWCAAGIRLFGPDPYWLKLWLLPIVLLFVFSLHALGRRFTDGLETLFVFVVVTSAAVLPCVNLMLDVPSLALGLASIAVFMRACDHRSVFEATVAGLIAGLAMETKYTAFTAPAAMLLYSLRVRRLRLGLLALVIAGGVFLAWEGFIAAKYGDSHFWLGAMQYSAPLSAKLRLVQPLFGCLGALVPFLFPMALVALGYSSRAVAAVSGILAIGVAMFALPECVWPTAITPKMTGVMFGIIGLMVSAAVAVVAVRLIRGSSTNAAHSPSKQLFSEDAFLTCWLVLEIGGYFALSPYAAARRVIGVVVLLSLLIVLLAAKNGHPRTKVLWMVAALSAIHGLFLFVVDDNWWRGRKELISQSARVCRAEDPKATIWYFGDTAFDFYANRQGMQRLLFSEAIPASGDLVVVVEGFEDFFHRHPTSSRCVESGMVEWRSRLPIKSQFQASSVPIARRDSPRFRALIYRVR
jgi:hypothetical protein